MIVIVIKDINMERLQVSTVDSIAQYIRSVKANLGEKYNFYENDISLKIVAGSTDTTYEKWELIIHQPWRTLKEWEEAIKTGEIIKNEHE